MAHDLPQRGRAHVLGDLAIRAVSNCFPEEWIIRPESPDYGVDLIVDIVVGGAVTGVRFGVQVKGTDTKPAKKSLSVSGIKSSSIHYWQRRPERIMFVVFHRGTKTIAWRWAGDIPDPSTATTTVSVSTEQTLEAVDWKKFVSEMDGYYNKRFNETREEINQIQPALPVLHKGLKKTQDAQPGIAADCGIDIFTEAAIVHYGGNNVGILDCGGNSVDQVILWLRERKIRHLSFLAISHFHIDHYVGASAIMSAVDSIGAIFIPPVRNEKLFKELGLRPSIALFLADVKKWHEKGAKLQQYEDRSYIIQLGKGRSGKPITLEIYFPLDALAKAEQKLQKAGKNKVFINPNDLCPVFRIVEGRTAFLIPGDATIPVWKEIHNNHGDAILSDGLVLPHNGSRMCLSDEILPSVIRSSSFPAVYSPWEKFKLPSPETIQAVTRRGGLLINVEKRPANILMNGNTIELQ